jgi:hypothetical protein
MEEGGERDPSERREPFRWMWEFRGEHAHQEMLAMLLNLTNRGTIVNIMRIREEGQHVWDTPTAWRMTVGRDMPDR